MRNPIVQSQLPHQEILNRRRADLVELVDPLEDRGRIFDPQATVEALGEFAVVHMHAHRWEPKLGVQAFQRCQHHQGCFHVMMVGQRILADDIDIGLAELPVAALLRSFAAPNLLYLIAPERKLQPAGMFQDIAGQRHRQIEVQTEIIVGVPATVPRRLQPPDGIDLLGDLTLAG